ncbi:EamA family transporter [Winogradskyella echinorum]|uniref:EamA family transporter n=1 Tax=Winogradskyella echinorum TaxID=538189 RepID=A0ABR6Y6Z1_9FLAO|nr:EamA family transporter [Winogradskyella echinorum]MBC3848043.1 EamA family transporter [Winogradskyella echinorum]MBC5752391.1 EamA family transporter [Winogradskyella echinorum]
MIYLLLSILSSTAIFVLFKLFDKYKINTLQAIVVNYATAFICGLLLFEEQIIPSEIIHTNWFKIAIGLGFLFIAIFNVMALTAQKNGLTVVSVASKMSVIIPIVFGIYVYNESAGFQKITGIVLALIAVYLTSVKQKDEAVLSKALYLPIILFFGSGVIDTSVNHFAPKGNMQLFLAVIFGMAGCIGLIILSYKSIVLKEQFKIKSVPFGIMLGIANYCSMYFLLKALRVDGFESSSVFTINNVTIVAVSTLIGLLLFKEHISKTNWIGIIIAIVSIMLVTLT